MTVSEEADASDIPALPIPSNRVTGMKLFVDYMDRTLLDAVPIYIPDLEITINTQQQVLIEILIFADFVNELERVIFDRKIIANGLTDENGDIAWYTSNVNVIRHVYPNWTMVNGLALAKAGNIAYGSIINYMAYNNVIVAELSKLYNLTDLSLLDKY